MPILLQSQYGDPTADRELSMAQASLSKESFSSTIPVGQAIDDFLTWLALPLCMNVASVQRSRAN